MGEILHVEATVRGKDSAYVQYEGVRYEGPYYLDTYIGTTVQLTIDTDDISKIAASVGGNGNRPRIATLTGQGGWGYRSHTLEQRRTIMGLRRKKMMIFDAYSDPVAMYYWYETHGYETEEEAAVRRTKMYRDSEYHLTHYSVPLEIRAELLEHEQSFQRAVASLSTLDDRSLAYDPTRKCESLWRHEGGLVFKNSAVHFDTHSVSPKSTTIPIGVQNLNYPIVVTHVITELCSRFAECKGQSVKDRLIQSGISMLHSEDKRMDFRADMQRDDWHLWHHWGGFFDILERRVVFVR